MLRILSKRRAGPSKTNVVNAVPRVLYVVTLFHVFYQVQIRPGSPDGNTVAGDPATSISSAVIGHAHHDNFRITGNR
jgi:hypothetical protein